MTLHKEQDKTANQDDSQFPIRELSLKTGVNSVTLRAWERRYGLLKPKRTAKGHRLYSNDDVLRVEGIVRWIQQGVAVSKVRALLDQEKGEQDLVLPENEWLEWQKALVKAANGYQEDKIEQLYQQIFSQYPALIAVRNWLVPSLEQLENRAAFVFCESVLIHCLSTRLASLKMQHKGPSNILITGQSSQRTLWCYMAAAIISDKGMTCRLIPNATHNDWSDLVEGTQAQSVLAFCDNDLAPKAKYLISQMEQWKKPVVAIGGRFWLAANDFGITQLGGVMVYSDALEGVSKFIDVIEN